MHITLGKKFDSQTTQIQIINRSTDVTEWICLKRPFCAKRFVYVWKIESSGVRCFPEFENRNKTDWVLHCCLFIDKLIFSNKFKQSGLIFRVFKVAPMFILEQRIFVLEVMLVQTKVQILFTNWKDVVIVECKLLENYFQLFIVKKCLWVCLFTIVDSLSDFNGAQMFKSWLLQVCIFNIMIFLLYCFVVFFRSM